MTPQRFKDETLRTLVDVTEAAARRHPSVLLFEDAHWADPTTLEVLDLLIDRVKTVPLLVVLTHRPEFQSRWSGQGHVGALNLSKLTRTQSAAMVSALLGGRELPAVLLEQILTRTDGVPLFVEELTKSILESGELKEAGDRYEYAGPARVVTIPATLRDSLMARLDRFMPVKEIAQIGAAIGREFSYELIATVAPMSQAQLDDSLARLTESGLASRRGTPPDAVYTFKHALVQDAAYDLLLKSRRQELHGKIARVIEDRFPTVRTTEPEVLAHHCEEAGLTEKAVGYCLKAGQQGMARFATTDAISQLRKGLALISRLPDGAERQAQELDLTSLLGHALMTTRGFSAPKSGDLFDRACQLCKQLGRPQQFAAALNGRLVYRFVRAEFDRAEDHAHEMLRQGEQLNDVRMKHNSLYLSGVLCAVMGKLVDACAYFEKSLGLWDPEFRTFTSSPEDPFVVTRSFYYRALLCLGHVDKARLVRSEAATEARRLSPFILAYALWQHWVGDWAMDGVTRAEAMLRSADEVLALSNEHGFAAWLAYGNMMRGWCLAMLGRGDKGLQLILEGVAACRDLGFSIMVPFWLAVLAEANGHVGQFEEGLERLDQAGRMIETTQERWFEAEVHRLRGQILMKMNDRAAAENSFGRAVDLARQQNAKFWELRAATSLARLWCEQGKSHEARQLLAPVYGWFTEGLDTEVLKEAKSLLTELG